MPGKTGKAAVRDVRSPVIPTKNSEFNRLLNQSVELLQQQKVKVDSKFRKKLNAELAKQTDDMPLDELRKKGVKEAKSDGTITLDDAPPTVASEFNRLLGEAYQKQTDPKIRKKLGAELTKKTASLSAEQLREKAVSEVKPDGTITLDDVPGTGRATSSVTIVGTVVGGIGTAFTSFSVEALRKKIFSSTFSNVDFRFYTDGHFGILQQFQSNPKDWQDLYAVSQWDPLALGGVWNLAAGFTSGAFTLMGGFNNPDAVTYSLLGLMASYDLKGTEKYKGEEKESWSLSLKLPVGWTADVDAWPFNGTTPKPKKFIEMTTPGLQPAIAGALTLVNAIDLKVKGMAAWHLATAPTPNIFYGEAGLVSAIPIGNSSLALNLETIYRKVENNYKDMLIFRFEASYPIDIGNGQKLIPRLFGQNRWYGSPSMLIDESGQFDKTNKDKVLLEDPTRPWRFGGAGLGWQVTPKLSIEGAIVTDGSSGGAQVRLQGKQ